MQAMQTFPSIPALANEVVTPVTEVGCQATELLESELLHSPNSSILQQNKAQNIEKSPGDVGMSLSPNALVQKSSIA